MTAATFENTEDTDEFGKRDAAALKSCMSVLEDVGRARGAPDLYVVVSDSGKSYLVDAIGLACECRWAQYNQAPCKHVKRVQYATGAAPIPSWVNLDAVDDQLGLHVSATPLVCVPGGGTRPFDE